MGMLVGACLIGQVRAAPASDPARKQAAASPRARAASISSSWHTPRLKCSFGAGRSAIARSNPARARA